MFHDLWQRLTQQVIINHAFIDVVLDYDNLGMFLEDCCYSAQLLMSEDLSHRVVRSSDNENLSFFIESLLKLIPVEIPLVFVSGLNGLFLKSFNKLCLCVLNT